MKKQYTTPKMKVINAPSADIICTSTGFGDGTTDTMHSKGIYGLDDEDDLLY